LPEENFIKIEEKPEYGSMIIDDPKTEDKENPLHHI